MPETEGKGREGKRDPETRRRLVVMCCRVMIMFRQEEDAGEGEEYVRQGFHRAGHRWIVFVGLLIATGGEE